MTFKVRWEIVVDGISPVSAALEALDCIVNGTSKVFYVSAPVRKIRPDGQPGKNRPAKVQVDLDRQCYAAKVRRIMGR